MILINLFLTFLKIGLFTIGGGYAMIPLIQSEVLNNGWISNSDLLNFIAISESTPGPFAINIATFIGAELYGFPGAFCATFGVVFPSFIIILFIAVFYRKYQKNYVFFSALTGLKPTVVGLIGSAVISNFISSFLSSGFNPLDYTFYISFFLCIAFIIMAVKKINPIFIIVIAGGIGVIIGYTFNL